MQGNLNEIDIRSILQLIELGQRTGELFVEAYSAHHGSRRSDVRNQGYAPRNARSFIEQFWFVFFLNGEIIYVVDSDSSLSRLRDYLRHYRVDVIDSIEVPSLASNHAPEYAYLWALLEHHLLTPAQARSIIQSIVHETLFDLLSLHQGSFIFESGGPALAPQLTTFEIGSLVTKIMKQVQEWKQLHLHIQSPSQYLVIADTAQLRQTLPEPTVNNLERWAKGKTSLRQMARYMNRDILMVAKAIYPFVQQGWVQLVHPVTRAITTTDDSRLWRKKNPCIVCIDDDTTICKAVEVILAEQGYEAISLNDSLKALSLVFQLKPDLILCDILMPELDGYELCAMLRRASMFRQTPIIMLTGVDQFIDRVRARMLGATDYLSKPFANSELLMLVEKHLSSSKASIG